MVKGQIGTEWRVQKNFLNYKFVTQGVKDLKTASCQGMAQKSKKKIYFFYCRMVSRCQNRSVRIVAFIISKEFFEQTDINELYLFSKTIGFLAWQFFLLKNLSNFTSLDSMENHLLSCQMKINIMKMLSKVENLS